jgi:hypothetical protein
MVINSSCFLLLITVTLSLAGSATVLPAQLTDSQLKVFDELTASFPVFSCDSMPLARAVTTPACLIAKHLVPFAQWIAAKGKNVDECKKELLDRQQSLTDQKLFPIDLTDMPIVGDSSAPVTIVLYLSGLCPLCKNISCELYQEETSGMLKSFARFIVKPCKTSMADEAIVAANHFKKPWEFLVALHKVKIRPDGPVLMKLADSLGIDSVRFKQYLNSPELQSAIERNGAEAEHNEVVHTPTIFINMRE